MQRRWIALLLVLVLCLAAGGALALLAEGEGEEQGHPASSLSPSADQAPVAPAADRGPHSEPLRAASATDTSLEGLPLGAPSTPGGFRVEVTLNGAPYAEAELRLLTYEPSRERRVRTDAEGTFALPAEYRRGRTDVVAVDPALIPRRGIRMFFADEQDTEPRRARFHLGATIEGRVLIPAGKTADDVLVVCNETEASVNSSPIRVSPDADGRYRIVGVYPERNYVRVNCTGYAFAYLELDVPVLGETVRAPDLAFASRPRVHGRIVPSRPVDLTGGWAHFIAKGAAEPAWASASLGPRGGFEIFGLPPGQYRVALSSERVWIDHLDGMLVVPPNRPEVGPVELRLDADAWLSETATVELEVQGPNGAVAGASVQLQERGSGYQDLAKTDAQGRCTLSIPPSRSQHLVVASEGLVMAEQLRLNLGAGQEHRLQVQLVPGGRVRGRLTGAEEEEIEESTVQVENRTVPQFQSFTFDESPGEQGEFEIDGLSPGELELWVEPGSYSLLEPARVFQLGASQSHDLGAIELPNRDATATLQVLNTPSALAFTECYGRWNRDGATLSGFVTEHPDEDGRVELRLPSGRVALAFGLTNSAGIAYVVRRTERFDPGPTQRDISWGTRGWGAASLRFPARAQPRQLLVVGDGFVVLAKIDGGHTRLRIDPLPSGTHRLILTDSIRYPPEEDDPFSPGPGCGWGLVLEPPTGGVALRIEANQETSLTLD